MLKRLSASPHRCVAVVATIPRAEIVEQVLVKVNGEIITKTEFEARQVAELRNRRSSRTPRRQRRVAEGGRADHAGPHPERRGRTPDRPARPGIGFALGDQQFARSSRTSGSRTTCKTRPHSRKP